MRLVRPRLAVPVALLAALALAPAAAAQAEAPARPDSAVAWALAPELPAAADSAAEAGGVLVGTGRASYYGERLRGRPTASGERFDPDALTAAHPTLPFGTRLRVTHEETGRSVVVRVNDRGPFHGSRVIDVSTAAAREIGMIRSGTARVRVERLPAGPRG